MQERGIAFDQGRQWLGLLDAVQRALAYLARLLPILDLPSMELLPGASQTCNCIAFNGSHFRPKIFLVYAEGVAEDFGLVLKFRTSRIRDMTYQFQNKRNENSKDYQTEWKI